MIKKTAVIGTGRWGSTLAIYLSNIGLDITLFSHSPEIAAKLRQERESPRLPGYQFPNAVNILSFKEVTFETFDAVVISTPVMYLRETLDQLKGIRADTAIIGINKGVEEETFMIPPQITAEFFPLNPYAQLSGPCFPHGLLDAKSKAAETLACRNYEIGLNLQKLLSSEKMRLYFSRDVDGVAYMGALKNIYAIAAGFIEALELNEEAIAIMITRAVSELRKFCRIMSIPEETLYGLSGLGDLLLTCYSRSSSHNKTFGKLFAQNKSFEQTVAMMNNAVAEGVFTTKAVYDMCLRLNIDMPIVKTLYKLLYEKHDIQSSLSMLMSRPLKIED